MEDWFANFMNLIWGIMVLVLLYTLLILGIRFLSSTYWAGNKGQRLIKLLKSFIVLYEPLAVLILMALFVKLNPLVNGIIVGLAVALSYRNIMNYIDGRLFLATHPLEKNQPVRIDGEEGTITDTGRLGFVFKTKEGTQHMSYSELQENGYTILKGVSEGNFHYIEITKPDSLSQEVTFESIRHSLFNNPYLDWEYLPSLTREESGNWNRSEDTPAKR